MDIKGSQAVILPEGAFVIGTYDAEGKPDAMIAAWGTQSDYGEITFFLAKHKTTENIKVTKAFTVAFATEETMVISDYFGLVSENKDDKIFKSGVHVHKAPHVNAPVIEEYPLTLECEVKSYDDETGILVGTIVNELADDSILTDGNVDPDKFHPILFDPGTGTYRKIGPVVGKAFHAGLQIRNDTAEW